MKFTNCIAPWVLLCSCSVSDLQRECERACEIAYACGILPSWLGQTAGRCAWACENNAESEIGALREVRREIQNCAHNYDRGLEITDAWCGAHDNWGCSEFVGCIERVGMLDICSSMRGDDYICLSGTFDFVVDQVSVVLSVGGDDPYSGLYDVFLMSEEEIFDNKNSCVMPLCLFRQPYQISNLDVEQTCVTWAEGSNEQQQGPTIADACSDIGADRIVYGLGLGGSSGLVDSLNESTVVESVELDCSKLDVSNLWYRFEKVRVGEVTPFVRFISDGGAIGGMGAADCWMVIGRPSIAIMNGDDILGDRSVDTLVRIPDAEWLIENQEFVFECI